MEKTTNKYTLKYQQELLTLLYQQCYSIFRGHHLPSHDHLHHLRVWNYTKDLLNELSESGRIFTSNEISLMMLSVFFHDTGLTKTLGEDHGAESRKICEAFLNKQHGLFSFDTNPALKAIELHDRKESPSSLPAGTEAEILKILSICDDLDAYGPIGIVRYAEIYYLRGIPLGGMSEKVLQNMTCRFDFFIAQQWIPESFFLNHKARYLYARRFYESIRNNDLSDQINQDNMNIIEYYIREVYHNSTGISDFASSLLKSNNDRERSFGSSLLSDLAINCGYPETE